MPKRKPRKAAPALTRTLRTLLTALQGAPFTGAIAQPQRLLSSLAGIRSYHPKAKFVPVTAKIDTTVRLVEDEGCDKRADIVAMYMNFLNPGDLPIGEATVTDLPNDAAAQRCANELQCPSNCPASFTPQRKLYEYDVVYGLLGGRDYEVGILTYPKTVWNCRCGKSDVEL